MPVETLPNQLGDTKAPVTTYDEVPYVSLAFPQTHPDRMAVMATLFELKPKAITESRVLELGCASGGNLIPMAYMLPSSEFVGVDLSQRQVEEGQAAIKDLELKNIELRQQNLLDISDDLGTFDYIICHGVFSWVPENVQDKILQICKRNLAPHGVAYISYNTLPGWRLRGMIREMMLYHVAQFDKPADRILQARALVEFLCKTSASIKAGHSPSIQAYEKLLQDEAEFLRNLREDYLLHEFLEEVNEPLYFYEFVNRAENHGLQYLAEAQLSTMLPANLSKEAQEGLQRVSGQQIKTEQYMDFIRNRTFRQTLVCHKDAQIDRNVNAERIMSLFISSPARTTTEKVDMSLGQIVRFDHEGAFLETRQPVVKAALLHLSTVWPKSLSFDDLLDISREQVNSTSERKQDAGILAGELLMAYTVNLLDFRTIGDRFVTSVSEKPLASRVARFQAMRNTHVTSQLHEAQGLDIFSRHALNLLDGQRDLPAISRELQKLVQDGVMHLFKDGEPVRDPHLMESIINEQTSEVLNKMAKAAVLTA